MCYGHIAKRLSNKDQLSDYMTQIGSAEERRTLRFAPSKCGRPGQGQSLQQCNELLTGLSTLIETRDWQEQKYPTDITCKQRSLLPSVQTVLLYFSVCCGRLRPAAGLDTESECTENRSVTESESVIFYLHSALLSSHQTRFSITLPLHSSPRRGWC